MKKKISALWRSNSGSATVTVIVTMLMVIALGAALMFGAYTSYQIAVTQRADSKNFYTAEAAMDDIRAGVQEQVSAALSAAYTQTLTEYAQAASAYEPQAKLAQYFEQKLKETGGFYAENGSYDTAKLLGFVAETAREHCVVSGEGAVLREETEGLLTALTLSKVSLRSVYDGYESDITTDIRINIPSFTGSIGDYAIVAQGGIIQTEGRTGAITGTVFSGADISVNRQSTLRISGNIFVADDLVLGGSQASAALSGKYVGFGSGANPDASSAILVNGKGSVLNISGLEQLTLAGISFIDVISANLADNPAPDTYTDKEMTNHFGSAVPMGQSMSFKANQLAYLVPAECLENYPSNPCVLHSEVVGEGEATTTTVVAPVVKSDVTLWTIDGSAKRLSDYIGSGKGSAVTLYKNMDSGNVQIAYVFLMFTEQTAANTYFRDYFTAFPERISQYLDFYLQLSDMHGAVSAAGYTFKTEEGELKLGNEPQTGITAQGRRFEDFVYEERLGRLDETRTFSAGGKTAVVTNGDYTVDSKDTNTVLVISGGNVTVKRNFEGAILAGGTMTMGDVVSGTSVTAAPLPDGILTTVAEEDRTVQLSDFLKGGYNSGEEAAKNAWAAENLVVYQNWAKN